MALHCDKLYLKKLSDEIKVTLEKRVKPNYVFQVGGHSYTVYCIKDEELNSLPIEMMKMFKSFMKENTVLIVSDGDYYYMFDGNLNGSINYFKSYAESKDIEIE